jgi:lipopolysaccharide/colanic/teichoic acid biosynthesis glycosyltransferase
MHYNALLKTNGKLHAKHRDSEEEGPVDNLPLVPARYFQRNNYGERGLAMGLLIIATPVTLVLILMIRLTSRGPALFRQVRVGLNGRTFMMYKLRTMRQDAEAGTGAVWTQPQDPRITRFGRFLRFLHLDEFPQLVNVVKGEMALIGPRPERPEFTQVLALKIPGYMQRHSVRPGITGLAQIQLAPDSDLNSVRRKLVLDLEYTQRGSFGLDARIFLATLLRMVGIPFELSVRVLHLKSHHLVGPVHRARPKDRLATERLQTK